MPAKIIWRKAGLIKVRDRRTGTIRYGYVATIDGRKYQASKWARLKDAQVALATLRASEGADGSPRAADRKCRVTLSQALAAWTSDARARGAAEGTITRFGGVLRLLGEGLPRRMNAYIDQIGTQELTAFRDRRLAGGKHPHTVKTDFHYIKAVLRSVPRLFGEKTRIAAFAIPQVRTMYSSRDQILTRGQIASLLAHLDQPPDASARARYLLTRDWLVLALHTAMRLQEIIQLRRADVDLIPRHGWETGMLWIIPEKKKEKKRVPVYLCAEAAEIIRRRTTAENLFLGDHAPGSVAAVIRRTFRQACEACGIPYGYKLGGVVLHTTRHTATSYLISQGYDLATVQVLTRHSNNTMAMRYAHYYSSQAVSAAKALAEIGNGVPPDSSSSAAAARSAPIAERESVH